MGCPCAAASGTRWKDFVGGSELGVLRQHPSKQHGNTERGKEMPSLGCERCRADQHSTYLVQNTRRLPGTAGNMSSNSPQQDFKEVKFHPLGLKQPLGTILYVPGCRKVPSPALAPAHLGRVSVKRCLWENHPLSARLSASGGLCSIPKITVCALLSVGGDWGR